MRENGKLQGKHFWWAVCEKKFNSFSITIYSERYLIVIAIPDLQRNLSAFQVSYEKVNTWQKIQIEIKKYFKLIYLGIFNLLCNI